MANDNPTSSDQVIPAAGNPAPYLQNRELSWLDFNERVLEQGADESVPLLQRLNFISIFWSNLQEFFMVRVGSLTDLSLVKKHIVDSKSNMTPSEQLRAIYLRCHELYPAYERTFEQVTQIPVVLGGYFAGRHINNAFNRVVISGQNARDSLEESVKDINRELKRRRESSSAR